MTVHCGCEQPGPSGGPVPTVPVSHQTKRHLLLSIALSYELASAFSTLGSEVGHQGPTDFYRGCLEVVTVNAMNMRCGNCTSAAREGGKHTHNCRWQTPSLPRSHALPTRSYQGLGRRDKHNMWEVGFCE